MVVYFFRTAWSLGLSTLERSLHRNKLPFSRIAFADTHVWKGRAGILDLGLGSHMNEAAVVSNMELARWHASGLNGIVGLALSRKWSVMVVSNMINHCGEMYPMQPYEVHSKVVFWDDTFQFFTHRFVCPDTGKLLVEAVTRTIIKDHKRNTIQFEKVLEILDVERERPTEMPDVVQGFLKWDAATKVHMESVQVKPEMEKKEITQ
ncbi:hypothetical protein LEN26_017447 [Aphanomyces euteiches]|nr:hypothetical protein LEN26_017447 [Aphanomyces euteiches]KAH9129222.1 hypothetical protein AeMF1_000727 [Aphanomyces euteiches]KAH9186655.1 hypothetical protein AeNC1_011372 [Aphanomyces euteiches]